MIILFFCTPSGRSLCLYSHIEFSTSEATFFEYIIDHEQPVKFNITSPLSNTDTPHALLDRQLILQTPPLTPGPHRLRMSLVDAPKLKSDANIFSLQNIIVQTLPSSVFKINFGSQSYQSDTSTVAQPTISNLPSSSSSSSSSNVPIQLSGPSKIDHGTIVAIVVSVSLFLVVQLSIIIWFVRRAKRRKDTSAQSSQIEAISPFISPPAVETGISANRSPSIVRRGKGSRSHGDLGLLPRSMKFYRSINQRHSGQQAGPSTVCYGGTVNVARSNADVEVEEEVINLPPVYNTIAIARPVSV